MPYVLHSSSESQPSSAQRERDQHRLDNKRLSLRERDRLRSQMVDEGEPTRAERKPRAAPTYPPMLLTTTSPTADPLARVLTWANAQTPEVKPAAKRSRVHELPR